MHGETHDGKQVWATTGTRLIAFDPATGAVLRTIYDGMTGQDAKKAANQKIRRFRFTSKQEV